MKPDSVPLEVLLALRETTAEVGRYRQRLHDEQQPLDALQRRSTDPYLNAEVRRLDEVEHNARRVLDAVEQARHRKRIPAYKPPDMQYRRRASDARHKRRVVLACVAAGVLVAAAAGLLARAWADLPVVQLDASTGACVGVVAPEGEDQWSCDRLPPKFVTRWVL